MVAGRRSPPPPVDRPAPLTIAVVVKGWPRLSETFVAQELVGLERRGLDLALFSLRRPTDRLTHALHGALKAPVVHLPEYLHRAPRAVFAAWAVARARPGYARAVAAWRADLLRDPTRNRVRRFGQAMVLVASLPAATRAIYAHFIHTPGSVARYAALMTGLPLALSAHARDIWTSRAWDLTPKLDLARWTTTCTAVGRDGLATLTQMPDRIALIRHGIDLARFPPPPPAGDAPDGSDPARPVRILSVCRLVEKKGIDDLLHALARLPGDLHWHFTHVGGGPLLTEFRRLAEVLAISARVTWEGPRAQERVLAAYRAADMFVLPSRIAQDNDRDGLPNVLMEAASQELALVSTELSAIPEFISDGVHGRLVTPHDPAGLAAALANLITDPDQRLRLAAAAAARVRADFTCDAGLDQIAARLTEL
jgi:glycosyltransferase involved in cell wall biosynthesis